MFSAFYRYRSQAFRYEISLLSQQLKQLLGFLFMLLASALPGIVLLIFMSLGKVIKAQGGEVVQAWVAWCFLAGQTLYFYALNHALLNTKQRSFQRSLAQNYWWLWLADARNLLLSHVFIWCSLFVLLSMNAAQIKQNSPFILFIVLQLLLGFLSLYRMQQSVIFCFLAAISSVYWSELSLFAIMVSWCFITLLCLFIPPISWQSRFSVTDQRRLWLSFYLHHYQILLWRMACILVIFSAMCVLATERADMIYLAGYFSGFLTLLLLLTLHIEIKKIAKDYELFLLSLNQAWPFKRMRLLSSVVGCTLLTIAIFVVFGQGYLAIALWCISVMCLYLAEKKPEHIALVWGIYLVGGLFI